MEYERLRLIFTTCHPILAPEARVALTLRLLEQLGRLEEARAELSQASGLTDNVRELALLAGRITGLEGRIR